MAGGDDNILNNAKDPQNEYNETTSDHLVGIVYEDSSSPIAMAPTTQSMNKSSADAAGYPRGKARRQSAKSPTDLTPAHHFRQDSYGNVKGYIGNYTSGESIPLESEDWMRWTGDRRDTYADDQSYLVPYKGVHFTRDMNDTQKQDPQALNRPTSYPDGLGGVAPVFSGSTTFVNAENDQNKAEIIRETLSESERKRIQEIQGDINSQPPLSPLHPFTRLGSIQNRHDARIANFTTFNRFHLPIADLEHRKAFRHVFFTRPECYIMCKGNKLCQQAEYDEDFNTSFARFPHISALLSPVYVTGSFGTSGFQDNFNYLLSNRCSGLTPTGTTLSTQDTIGKSIGGYTVTPGMHYEGRQGSTITVTFRDTKDLEVYEYIRMWMLYIWKRKYGTFAPSFNGYQYKNGFPECTSSKGVRILNVPVHPFDRALDYTCSMFDWIMDESGEFAKYWCKYYGLYPIDLQCEGLSNANNDALKSELTVTVTFKYQYKIENVMRSLIEFNYNAGICNNMGSPRINFKSLMESQSFFYRDNGNDKVLPNYNGPAGMFTGTPFIVMVAQDKDYMKLTNGKTVTPSLKFLPITNTAIDKRINLGLTSVAKNNNIVAQSDLSDVQQSAYARKQQAAKQAELDEKRYSSSIANAIDEWDPMEAIDTLKKKAAAAAIKSGAFGDRFSVSEDGNVHLDLTDFGGAIDKFFSEKSDEWTSDMTTLNEEIIPGVVTGVAEAMAHVGPLGPEISFVSDDNTSNTEVNLVNSEKKDENIRTDIQSW